MRLPAPAVNQNQIVVGNWPTMLLPLDVAYETLQLGLQYAKIDYAAESGEVPEEAKKLIEAARSGARKTSWPNW